MAKIGFPEDCSHSELNHSGLNWSGNDKVLAFVSDRQTTTSYLVQTAS